MKPADTDADDHDRGGATVIAAVSTLAGARRSARAPLRPVSPPVMLARAMDVAVGYVAEPGAASGGQAAILALHKRFTTLQAAAAEHAQLLGTSLDDTNAALKLVNVQLASLLAQAS